MRIRVELELDDGRIIGASRPVVVSSTRWIEYTRLATKMVNDIGREAFGDSNQWG